MDTIREHLWIWGHVAGSYNGEYGLPDSTMGALEGAQYLGVENLILISYKGLPEPPYENLARELSPLKRVVWSVVGAGGTSRGFEEELTATQALAAQFPNFVGAMMDDFFKSDEAPQPAVYTPEQLAALRERLHASARPLDLWVVLYAHQLHMPIAPHLAECDVLTFWTWKAEELSQLEENFARAEVLAPRPRKVLGLYMFDFGNARPLPVPLMERQCELGLKWLREGRVEGLILLSTSICDLGLETVEWSRRWIEAVGDEQL